MTDPATVTVATIVALAASKFVGKASEKTAEVVAPAVLERCGEQIDGLWSKIKGFLQKHGDEKDQAKAEAALAKVEAGDEAALTKLEVYLEDALEEPQYQRFAGELQQLAQQIVNVQQQTQAEQINNNYGRDMFVLNQPEGDLKLGGS